ncbi:hypothetical protein [Nocardia kruczakiae]|uniref:hypothetical protein n=1 Tax=Nocardia kruczakiae TaxID=261477 RepID=UPI003F771D90
MAGSAAYSSATVATAHSGGGPTVGPAQAIGGFSGSDPVPTLAQFQADVKDGKIA